MDELKNKDGVPIRIPSVWVHDMKEAHSHEYEVIGIAPSKDALWIHSDDGFETYALSFLDNMHLQSDDVFGDMSEWRIVTEEEKREHPQPPRGAEFWAQGQWNGGYGLCWSVDVWRIPRGFKWPINPICSLCKKPVDILISKDDGMWCHEECQKEASKRFNAPKKHDGFNDSIDPLKIFTLEKLGEKINEIVGKVNKIIEKH